MEFKKIRIWILIIVILLIPIYNITNAPILCWDDLEVNEEKLMELCGTTPSEYWEQMELNSSFCLEGHQAFSPIGGCDPDYKITLYLTFIFSIIWLIIWAIIFVLIPFLIPKKHKKK